MISKAEQLRHEIEARLDELLKLRRNGDSSAEINLQLIAMDGYHMAKTMGLYPDQAPRLYVTNGKTRGGEILETAKLMIDALTLGESNDVSRMLRYSRDPLPPRAKVPFRKDNWLKWEPSFRFAAKECAWRLLRHPSLEVLGIVKDLTPGRARTALTNALVQKCAGMVPK